MCVPAARQATRFVVDGEGFGVEPIGLEVLMGFSKARHAGLELSRGPVGRWLWDSDEITPGRESTPRGKQRVNQYPGEHPHLMDKQEKKIPQRILISPSQKGKTQEGCSKRFSGK